MEEEFHNLSFDENESLVIKKSNFCLKESVFENMEIENLNDDFSLSEL